MNRLLPYNFIVIEGNIGAGKTSLAGMIAAQYNAMLILEQFEDNPFLPKFYIDPSKYAFPLELSFLASRYQQLSDELSKRDIFKSFTIADYFIHKSLIFARKTLQQDEYQLYSRLFHFMMNALPGPDLLVYLFADTGRLHENIRNRGREYEQSISADYLEKIHQSYLEHFRTLQGIPVLIINTRGVDFVHQPDDYQWILEQLSGHYPPGMHWVGRD